MSLELHLAIFYLTGKLLITSLSISEQVHNRVRHAPVMSRRYAKEKQMKHKTSVTLDIDGSGQTKYQLAGIGFLDHMLEQLARHQLHGYHPQSKG